MIVFLSVIFRPITSMFVIVLVFCFVVVVVLFLFLLLLFFERVAE